jgi:hypothetical protein
VEQRLTLVAQDVDEPPGGNERVQDLEQFRPAEPAAAPGSQHKLADVAGTSHAYVWPPRKQVHRLIGLVQHPLDDLPIRRRRETARQPARWLKSREVGQPRPDHGEFEKLLAARVHQSLAADRRPDTDLLPVIQKRRGRADQSPA